MTMTPEAPSNQPKAGIPSLEQTTKTLPLSATSHSLPPPSALSLLRHPASHHQRLNLPAHLPPPAHHPLHRPHQLNPHLPFPLPPVHQPVSLQPLLQSPPKPAVRSLPLETGEEESTFLPSLTAPLWMKSKRQRKK